MVMSKGGVEDVSVVVGLRSVVLKCVVVWQVCVYILLTASPYDDALVADSKSSASPCEIHVVDQFEHSKYFTNSKAHLVPLILCKTQTPPLPALGVSQMDWPCADGVRGLTQVPLETPLSRWILMVSQEQGERRMGALVAGRISHHTVTDHPCCFDPPLPKRQTLPKYPFRQQPCAAR